MNRDKDYNSQHRLDNCGYCSISAAMDAGVLVSRVRMSFISRVHKVGLKIEDGRDPVSRQLIFPEPGLAGMPAREGYYALQGGAIGLDNYTITSVASTLAAGFEA
jgi:hypothetical protein